KYFSTEQHKINQLVSERESVNAQMVEQIEEHGNEDGLLAEVTDDGKIKKDEIIKYIKSLGKETEENADELQKLNQYIGLLNKEKELTSQAKTLEKELEKKVINKYPTLTELDIKTLVVENKWMTTIEQSVKSEMDRISQRLAQRIKELVERYATPMPKLTTEVQSLTTKVESHLRKMGFIWT
ncbi:MAG: type I restriction endonuclease, partial [Proteobacteria bacterium]|nr:type I restriction endonuclease [Pseudomonadota bacterium]